MSVVDLEKYCLSKSKCLTCDIVISVGGLIPQIFFPVCLLVSILVFVSLSPRKPGIIYRLGPEPVSHSDPPTIGPTLPAVSVYY